MIYNDGLLRLNARERKHEVGVKVDYALCFLITQRGDSPKRVIKIAYLVEDDRKYMLA